MIRSLSHIVEPSPLVPPVHRRGLLRCTAAGLIVLLIPGRAFAQKKSKNLGVKRWPKPPPGVRKPRYTTTKQANAVVAKGLKPGFYFNPKSKVVHYVTRDGRIRDVQRIKVERLRPMTITNVTRLLLADPASRVHLTTASRALEEAALDHFQANQADIAFQLLATAIRHDQRLKQRSHEMPSLRLYDLFAAKAVQLGDKAKLNELLVLARQANAQVVKSAPPKVDRLQTSKPRSPTSAFGKWQKQRKVSAKSSAIAARKASYSAPLKKWAAAGTNNWKQKWERKDSTWNL